jgi:hypothetical protein
MQKLKYSFLLLLAFHHSDISYSQIKFEKGYFLDNAGSKTECLIRNVDWLYNPTFFEYKADSNAPKSRKEVNEVKEFGIERVMKYISAKVKIDRSSDNLVDNEISNSFDPDWKEEQIFLKVLTEGDATLLLYEEQGFTRYFYQINSSPIEQLIYKKYTKPGETSFGYNRNYLNQLFAHVNCIHSPIYSLENISYTSKALLNWFQKHNQCMDPNNKTPLITRNKKRFSLKIMAGVDYLSYQSGNSVIPAESNINYTAKIGSTFGVDVEFFFPFNNNKWSTFLESSTLAYSTSGLNSSGDKVTIAYYTIDLLAGVRYYAFLNDKIKILFDAGFVKDIKQVEITPAMGIGISYTKFMIEFRYFHQNNILLGYFDRSTGERFNNMFFALKYTLF